VLLRLATPRTRLLAPSCKVPSIGFCWALPSSWLTGLLSRKKRLSVLCCKMQWQPAGRHRAAVITQ
jgi:hypothetical protein